MIGEEDRKWELTLVEILYAHVGISRAEIGTVFYALDTAVGGGGEGAPLI